VSISCGIFGPRVGRDRPRDVAAELLIGYLMVALVRHRYRIRPVPCGRAFVFQAACSAISASALSAVMKRRLPTL
jgi:hypothetical protein